jgi:enediyne biosynthesis protein E4
VAADFDGDGWTDIYVACDTTYSLLFRNNHDGTFTEQALESGIALNDDGQEQSGMGLGIGDFNTDGYLDILKTHFTEDTPALYQNDGRASFHDVTIQAGLGVETRFVCWGAGMFDLDNNGLPDLFYATGMVYPEVEPFKTPRVLYRNLGGGKFEGLMHEAGEGVAEAHSSRGVAFGDFDNDGDLDILIVNLNEPPSLLRNDVTGDNHWLKILLEGTKSNRSAIGATVVATYGGRKQARSGGHGRSCDNVAERRTGNDSRRGRRPPRGHSGRGGRHPRRTFPAPASRRTECGALRHLWRAAGASWIADAVPRSALDRRAAIVRPAANRDTEGRLKGSIRADTSKNT